MPTQGHEALLLSQEIVTPGRADCKRSYCVPACPAYDLLIAVGIIPLRCWCSAAFCACHLDSPQGVLLFSRCRKSGAQSRQTPGHRRMRFWRERANPKKHAERSQNEESDTLEKHDCRSDSPPGPERLYASAGHTDAAARTDPRSVGHHGDSHTGGNGHTDHGLTPTLAAGGPWHPADTRTGIEQVDRVIAAFLTGDLAAKQALIRYTTTPAQRSRAWADRPSAGPGSPTAPLWRSFRFSARRVSMCGVTASHVSWTFASGGSMPCTTFRWALTGRSTGRPGTMESSLFTRGRPDRRRSHRSRCYRAVGLTLWPPAWW